MLLLFTLQCFGCDSDACFQSVVGLLDDPAEGVFEDREGRMIFILFIYSHMDNV